MKRKLLPAAYNKLSAELKKLYKKIDKDGKTVYELDVEDNDDEEDDDDGADDDDDSGSGDDANKLKTALQRERDANKKLRDDLRSLRSDFNKMKKDADDAAENDARNNGDVTALEASWKKKLSDREAELQTIIEAREGALREILVDSEANKLATQLTKYPKALLPHIKERLAAEFGDDGKAVTRVLKDGKPSALTIADLKKEFLADKELAGILTGSSGSGGGAGGQPGSGGGSFNLKNYQNDDGSVNWAKVNLARKDNPEIVSQVQSALNPSAAAEGQ